MNSEEATVGDAINKARLAEDRLIWRITHSLAALASAFVTRHRTSSHTTSPLHKVRKKERHRRRNEIAKMNRRRNRR